jgi:hypothetical protein
MLLTSFTPLERPLIITHVNVVAMDSERVIQDQTVGIEDGYIRTITLPATSIVRQRTRCTSTGVANS